jgi:hypothetical protein
MGMAILLTPTATEATATPPVIIGMDTDTDRIIDVTRTCGELPRLTRSYGWITPLSSAFDAVGHGA